MIPRLALPVFLFFLLLASAQGIFSIFYFQRLNDAYLITYATGVLEVRGESLPPYPGPPPASLRKLAALPQGELFLASVPGEPGKALFLRRSGTFFLLPPLPQEQGLPSPQKLLAPLLIFEILLSLSLLFFLLLGIREFSRISKVVGERGEGKRLGFSALSEALRLTLTNLEQAKREAEILAEERGKTLEELHRTQEQLLLKERLATLGYFSGGIAHEVGNPLSAALQFLEAAQGKGVREEERSRLIVQAFQELLRIEETLSALRALARPERITLHHTPLEPLLHEVLEELKRSTRYKFQEELAVPAPLFIHTNPPLFRIILRNLFLNSLKVQKGVPYLGISAHREGEWVLLEIRDGGPGFPEDFRPESLFTSAQGMGFGIPLALRISELLKIELRFLPGTREGRVQLRIPVVSR